MGSSSEIACGGEDQEVGRGGLLTNSAQDSECCSGNSDPLHCLLCHSQRRPWGPPSATEMFVEAGGFRGSNRDGKLRGSGAPSCRLFQRQLQMQESRRNCLEVELSIWELEIVQGGRNK